MTIDISFDFRSDTPPGKNRDPDKDSPTLHRYHRLLWSKPLPSGAPFDLVDGRPGNYLVHRSRLGDFYLSSDAVIATLKKRARHVWEQVPEAEREEFGTVGYTIGGMMLFPSNKVDGKMTLNGARGFNSKIADRFDLTLECIRRQYRGEGNPLQEPLDRYGNFFALFGDFPGYVSHFLLQDIVTTDCDGIRFFTPFEDFSSSPLPRDLAAYQEYKRRSIAFVHARNQRIADFSKAL